MKLVIIFLLAALSLVSCSVLDRNYSEIEEEGLYRASDLVVILGGRNFADKVYGQKHAWVIQFYNSFCGHCRHFAPIFKEFARDVRGAPSVFRPAVIDCTVEANEDICRNFEILQYPSLRYIHPNFEKSNGNHGDFLTAIVDLQSLETEILQKLQKEQQEGRLPQAPSFAITNPEDYAAAVNGVPSNTQYTFVVFETKDSLVGTRLILDTSEYKDIVVKRAFSNSDLAKLAGITTVPALIVITNENMISKNLTPQDSSISKALIEFLNSVQHELPEVGIHNNIKGSSHHAPNHVAGPDIVDYSDLEATINFIIHVEITRYLKVKGEALESLKEFLNVTINNFPFKNANLQNYLISLRNALGTRQEWNGKDIQELVNQNEEFFAPIYLTNLEYVACKGSQPMYRGYTCGLWTLFHVLTVNAATKPGLEGPNVLKAMHGYVKNFFGCTDCAEHFLQMADRNHIFDIRENDKAILWLWISHNEVNLRLAGDTTEDPEYPKIQFPASSKCSTCRTARGSWALEPVLEYLQKVYGAGHITVTPTAAAPRAGAPSFSYLDIALLSIPYLFTFAIILFGLKYYITKRYYRKKNYKHGGWGKV